MPIQTANWLSEIEQQLNNRDWFEANIQDVYDTIYRLIRHEDTIFHAINALLIAYPHVIGRHDLREWGKLLQDANRIYRGFNQKNLPQMIYLLEPRRTPTRGKTAKRRPRDRVAGPEMLEIYLTLLMMVVHHHPEKLTTERLAGILRLSRAINDNQLNFKLYQTLAFIHNVLQQPQKATIFGNMAYGFWVQQDMLDPIVRLETGLSAYTIGIAYKMDGQPQLALQWLQTAAAYLARTEHMLQHSLLLLEICDSMIGLSYYEEAAEQAKICIMQARPMRLYHLEARAAYYLGLAQAHLNQFDDAEASLNKAVAFFNQNHFLVDEIMALRVLGAAEAQQGERESALQHLNLALAHLDEIPQPQQIQCRRDEIQAMIEQIEIGNSNIKLN